MHHAELGLTEPATHTTDSQLSPFTDSVISLLLLMLKDKNTEAGWISGMTHQNEALIIGVNSISFNSIDRKLKYLNCSSILNELQQYFQTQKCT